MLEIAGGIIIAYIVIKFWAQIAGILLFVLLIAVLLAMLAISIWFGALVVNGNQTATGVAALLGLIGALALIIWAVNRHDDKKIRAKYRRTTTDDD